MFRLPFLRRRRALRDVRKGDEITIRAEVHANEGDGIVCAFVNGQPVWIGDRQFVSASRRIEWSKAK